MKHVLMTHLYWGDPNEEFSFGLAKMLVSSGADILEIGIPYTDPVCDGEVFQSACSRAIAAGITPLKVIQGIKCLRESGITTPIYLTSYYGPVFKMGVETFVKKAKEAGVNGLIIPDILLEEQGELREAAMKSDLSIIQFATIYSSDKRLKQICEASTDFIYCMSLAGVTGDEKKIGNELKELIKRMRVHSKLNLLVGFGIRSQKDSQRIFSLGADGIIVGSAIAKKYEPFIEQGVDVTTLENIGVFVKSLKP